MANRQDFKDRHRDRNPRNQPPKAQIDEQKIKGRQAKDSPPTQKAKQAKAPPKPKGAKVADRKVVPEKREPKRRTDLNPLLRVTDTQSGTIHDEAARLKIRDTDATSPTEVVTVEGNKLEVVARPEVLHPVELLPHQRDTVIKDRLRDESDPESTAKADGTYPVEPPDWRDETAGIEAEAPFALSGPPTQPKKKGK